jgi:geranylgeranyl diphosphate synthase type II
MYSSNEILNKVNAFIEQLPYDRRPASLYDPIRYVLSLGGKRIRPQLMMMAYELWRENGEDVLPQAVALRGTHPCKSVLSVGN